MNHVWETEKNREREPRPTFPLTQRVWNHFEADCSLGSLKWFRYLLAWLTREMNLPERNSCHSRCFHGRVTQTPTICLPWLPAFNRPLKVCCDIWYKEGGVGHHELETLDRSEIWKLEAFRWRHPGPWCSPGNWHTHSTMDIKAKPGHHRTWSPSSLTLWSSFDVVVVLTFSEVLGSTWASHLGGNTVAPTLNKFESTVQSNTFLLKEELLRSTEHFRPGPARYPATTRWPQQ